MVRRFFTRFLRDESGAAAEYALVLPLAVLLFIGILDGGRYMWQLSRAEKATQAGARIAAVTAMIPQGLANYTYAVAGGLPQGSVVGESVFRRVRCTGTGTAASPGVNCVWEGTQTSSYALAPSAAAFDQVYDRMEQFMPGLRPTEVQVVYTNSGLGFAGDPSGPDVSPIITVRLVGVQFSPIFRGIYGTWGMPTAEYSISQEDGVGACFEEYPGANAANCDLG